MKRKFLPLFLILFLIVSQFAVFQFAPNVKAEESSSTVGTVGQPQNCTLIPTNEDGYSWKTANASYILYLKTHSNWGDGMKYVYTLPNGTSFTLIYQAQDYNFRDVYGSQDYITSITDVSGIVVNNTITYNNPYPNVTLKYSALPDMVKEEYIVYALPKTPASYLKPPITLDFGGYIKFPNLKMYVNGTEIAKGTDFTTSSRIEFGSNPENIYFYLPEPYAVDASNERTSIKYEVKNQNNQIWFYLRIPYEWLADESRVYPVTVDPSVVGTSTTSYATWYPFHRKSFYANGFFWVFYSDGTNMVYRTSTDGISWSSATAVRACAYGHAFSVWFDGTYLHYAYANGGNIYYRRGYPNSDGTITWSTDAEQTVSTTYNSVSHPFVSVDSSGYVWIGYMEYTGTYYYPYVIKSGYNNGSWGTTPSGFPYQLSTLVSAYWRVSIIPLTAGKMLAVYSYNGATVRAKKWNGTDWGTEKATTSAIYVGHYCSAVAQGDDVHLVFLKSTGYDILYTKYVYANDAFSGEVTVKAGATYFSAPVLSIDNTNKLYCFWATKTTGSPSGATANHIYYQTSADGGSTWSAMVDWINESVGVLTYADRLTCFYKQYGSYIGLVYMTNTTSPYNVKFDFLTVAVADTTPPTYSNVGTNTTQAGQPCKFSVLWNDNVNVSGFIFGTNNTGTWVNDTWVAFTVFYNSTAAWSNVTKTLNATVHITVAWQVWCNDTSNNWNGTGIQALTTTQAVTSQLTQTVQPAHSTYRTVSNIRQLTQQLTLSTSMLRIEVLTRAFLESISTVAQTLRNVIWARDSVQPTQTKTTTLKALHYPRTEVQAATLSTQTLRLNVLQRTAVQQTPTLTTLLRSLIQQRVPFQATAISLYLVRGLTQTRQTLQPSQTSTQTLRVLLQPRLATQTTSIATSTLKLLLTLRTSTQPLNAIAQSLRQTALQRVYTYSASLTTLTTRTTAVQRQLPITLSILHQILTVITPYNVRIVTQSIAAQVEVPRLTTLNRAISTSTALTIQTFKIKTLLRITTQPIQTLTLQIRRYTAIRISLQPLQAVFTIIRLQTLTRTAMHLAILRTALISAITPAAPPPAPPPAPFVPPPPIIPPPQLYALIVHVIDLFGQNAPGLTIKIIDEKGNLVATLTTGAEGTTNPIQLAKGTYTINVYKDNIFQLSQTITLTEPTTLKMQIGIPVAITFPTLLALTLIGLAITLAIVVAITRRRR